MEDNYIDKDAEFIKELAELINKHSLENRSNTPDFILAEHLVGCMKEYENTVNRRNKWFKEEFKKD